MSEETTPQATWTEGGPIDSMSGDDAKTEIKSIESDPSFAGDGKKDYWSRQSMIKRRDSLYRHAYPENVGKEYSGMEETLRNQGIDQEFLENEATKFEDRDYREEKKKAMDALSQHFGGEDQAKQALTDARAILKRFATPDDLAYLDETGLGSDSNFIQRLAEIGNLLKRGGTK